MAMTEETRQTIKANTEKSWEEKLKKANALPDSDEKRALLMLLHSQAEEEEGDYEEAEAAKSVTHHAWHGKRYCSYQACQQYISIAIYLFIAINIFIIALFSILQYIIAAKKLQYYCNILQKYVSS